MLTLEVVNKMDAIQKAREKLYESPLKGEEACCLDCEMLTTLRQDTPVAELVSELIVWLRPAMENGTTAILKYVDCLSDDIQVPLCSFLRGITIAPIPMSCKWQGEEITVRPGFEVLATIGGKGYCRRELDDTKISDGLARLYPHPKESEIIF